MMCGCNHVSDRMPKGVTLSLKNKELEVYKEYSINDIIDSNVEVTDSIIDTNSIGSKDLDIYYIYKNKKYVYHTTYEVIDTVKPKIFGGSNKTVTVGSNIDLCSLVMYGDNYDSEPICTVVGEYDLNTIGKYNIKLEVYDMSGNMNNHSITLNVIEKSDNKNNNHSNNNTSKLAFADAYSKYKDNYQLGIDVSEWQGIVDYEKVRASGATFVMMRIGVNTKSGIKVDGQYLNNIKAAKEAGLKVGVYLYSIAKSKAEAIEEAKWVIDLLNKEELDLPIVFDWEIWNGWNTYHMSFHDLNEMAKAFIKTVEDNGYQGMIYGSKFYLESFWDGTYSNVWLAHYTSNTTYQGYKIWQFSDKGVVEGINSFVDLDVLYK